MPEGSSIEENLTLIRQRVQQACERAGRDSKEITIIPVTKTVEPERMIKVADYGLPVVAENRVQEARRKIKALEEQASTVDWHFVGHLQSNKVNKVLKFASMIQSIDRMKIVRKINRKLAREKRSLDVLIQVNVSGEESKYGVDPSRALEFVEEAAGYEHLNIRGLMTIGLFSDDWPRVREGFQQLRQLRDEIAAKRFPNMEMKYLSMGMTNDFEIAVEEGAYMIRIGRGIFGEREHPNSYYWPGIDG